MFALMGIFGIIIAAVCYFKLQETSYYKIAWFIAIVAFVLPFIFIFIMPLANDRPRDEYGRYKDMGPFPEDKAL